MSPKSFRQTIGVSPSTVSASSGTTALLVIDSQGTYNTGAPLEISNLDASQAVIKDLVAKYRKVSFRYTALCSRTLFADGVVLLHRPTASSSGSSTTLAKLPSLTSRTPVETLSVTYDPREMRRSSSSRLLHRAFFPFALRVCRPHLAPHFVAYSTRRTRSSLAGSLVRTCTRLCRSRVSSSWCSPVTWLTVSPELLRNRLRTRSSCFLLHSLRHWNCSLVDGARLRYGGSPGRYRRP